MSLPQSEQAAKLAPELTGNGESLTQRSTKNSFKSALPAAAKLYDNCKAVIFIVPLTPPTFATVTRLFYRHIVRFYAVDYTLHYIEKSNSDHQPPAHTRS
jgi:hypothetical protein